MTEPHTHDASGHDDHGHDGHDHGHGPDHDGHGHDRELPDGKLYGVLAEYDTPGELVEAARKVRDAGFTEFDCYSPFPVHGIDEAMGIKRTILPALVFCGGATGTLGGILLQWWCNAYNWPWNISGKPSWSIPANVPIAFEATILLAVFTSFFGMWILNKLPQVWHPFFRNERFNHVTDDAFLLGIEAGDQRFDAETTPKLLKDAGAIEVSNVHLDPDPESRQMPRWITAFIVASTAFALIPFAIAAKARTSRSSEPHIHIFPDMDFQPKYKSDQPMDLFDDGRENRGEITGTIARGSLNADDLFFRGLENGQWTTGYPTTQLPITEALLKRGKNRFEIYCTPCHGYDGRGMGAIPTRVASEGGAWQARNLVDASNPVAINMPNGQLFNTISNGYSTMMGYAAQIPHADRWAIVLYVRALQRSQNASLEDIPVDHRSAMQMPEAPIK
ncbi:MAG TPA: quinol:electron acceptor oxidoreductase subunit ActD [Kofleriaceae bacterium]|jgi:mono/diheme cytochrome c family protein|nr:quinol:electron acceptor oxidoreductase subunit ActD [Kofleriaceae bacterium]